MPCTITFKWENEGEGLFILEEVPTTMMVVVRCTYERQKCSSARTSDVLKGRKPV
jgi:hypothetical protein